MLFPFYWDERASYTIDDADYWCERVIIATCDWSHRYATICELIENCPSVRQLTRPCIVNFFNDLESIQKKSNLDANKMFLRVWIDWCLELADPCICNQDKYVVATEDDNDPGPLDTKVKWSCSYDWLYCIDIEEWGPQTLVRRPSGPNWPFINPDMPDCDNAYVKMKQNGSEWKVYYECEPDNKPQHAVCRYTGGKASVSCKQRSIRYYATHANWPKPVYNWSVWWWEAPLNGDWAVIATDAFAAPKSYWVIRIVQPGVYEVAWSTYVLCAQTNHAIRAWVYIDEYDGLGIHELNDIKYQWWENDAWSSNPAFNRMHPFEWNSKTWTNNYQMWWLSLELTGIPFSRTYVIPVVDECELFMCVKPDMQYIDVRTQNDNDNRYFIDVQWTNSWAYGAITSMEITKISDIPHSSRYKILKP